MNTVSLDVLDIKESTYIDGVWHTSRRAIGEILGYADHDQAINRLVSTCPEIGAYYSTIGKISAGDEKPTVLFNAPGFFLLVMAAKKPKAKHLRFAMAAMLAQSMAPLLEPQTRLPGM